jgi:predicted nucleic acid-binding protein
MGVALLDSSAAVGYLDADDALHGSARAEINRVLGAGDGFALSVVSWAELLTGVRVGHHDEGVVRDFVQDFGVAILPVDQPVAEKAAELKAGIPKLRTPDALILATGELYDDIDAVIHGDATWPKVPGITVELRALLPGSSA